ncbi:hypothetical protein HZH68_004789 [Vespula germanica]|uniref:Uncharacterized protein n=1 Tax=Vespula germanica TaxID=30212 RepID=A0A834KPH4_VESGE|nr:hypothetical protein HZH68_004789 [Vespula germanica]
MARRGVCSKKEGEQGGGDGDGEGEYGCGCGGGDGGGGGNRREGRFVWRLSGEFIRGNRSTSQSDYSPCVSINLANSTTPPPSR